jgi:hypothetical protein
MAGEEVLAGFDAVVARDEGSRDAEARGQVAGALVGKGDALLGSIRRGDGVLRSGSRAVR